MAICSLGCCTEKGNPCHAMCAIQIEMLNHDFCAHKGDESRSKDSWRATTGLKLGTLQGRSWPHAPPFVKTLSHPLCLASASNE
eukprot:4726058-Amphidinium_carterae.2